MKSKRLKLIRPDPTRKRMPLEGYVGAVVAFNLLLGRLVAGRRDEKTPLADRLDLTDLALLGTASHKLSRVITKDIVMTPFRMPFTRFDEYLGYGESQEGARGRGWRETIGELLSCNYCADPWIALLLLVAFDRFPSRTRLVMKFFSAVAISDFLHVVYETTRTRENVLTLREQRLERQEREVSENGKAA
jgi:hypothetical protein